MTRRDVVAMGAKSATAIGVGLVTGGLISACGSSSSNDSPSTTTPTTTTSGTLTTNSSNQVTLDFTTYPNLNSTNGSYKVSIVAKSGTKTIVVTRGSGSVAYAVLPTCTHAGTTLGDLSSSSQTFTCPNHGAIFKANGDVVSGPTSTALTTYVASVSTSGVVVTVA